MKKRFWLGGLCLLGSMGAFAADDGDAAANPYASHSDRELTAIAADWETLSDEDRRALLTETRGRMDAKRSERGAQPVVAIRAQRRYGRLVRQPDGSVVRIETTERVVQLRPLSPEGSLPADQAFGVGFERRAGQQQPAAEDTTIAPVTPVRVDPASP